MQVVEKPQSRVVEGDPWVAASVLQRRRVARALPSYTLEDAVQDIAGACLAGCQTPKEALRFLRGRPLGYVYSQSPMPLSYVYERKLLRELGHAVGEALGNVKLGRTAGILLARKGKLPSVSELAKLSGYGREECEMVLMGVESVLIHYLEEKRVENPDGFLSNDMARLHRMERMAKSAPVYAKEIGDE